MESKDRPLVLITIVSICLIISALLPTYFKTLFVERTGHLTVVSPWIVAVLILGFLYRKAWSRKATLIVCKIAFFFIGVVLITTGFNDYRSIALTVLLLLQVACITLLRDESVKQFLERPRDKARIRSYERERVDNAYLKHDARFRESSNVRRE